ncbi:MULTISPECIES: hypothetical protein [Haloarcula]|uniref:hypothetical protein n=1 Tax=Haloarcula TaxID=2237 RepID=UPI0023EC7DCD|nr:hypothetical protein [Halomicroarcula sp. XH51]
MTDESSDRRLSRRNALRIAGAAGAASLDGCGGDGGSGGDDGDGDHDYHAPVDVVESKGDENVVHLAFEGAPAAQSALFTAVIDGMRSVDADQRLVAGFPESAVHLFDRATGEALHNRELAAADVPDL